MYHNLIMEELRKQGRLVTEHNNITVVYCMENPVLAYTDPDTGLCGHLHSYTSGVGVDLVKDQLDVELFQKIYSLVN